MIEVLFAVTIFSLVAVLGLTIMNQGTAASQRSLEITLVRQEINAQAESLRLLYDEAMAQKATTGGGTSTEVSRWNSIVNQRVASATPWQDMTDGSQCINPADITRAFVINSKTGAVINYSSLLWNDPSLYARVIYSTTSSNSVSSVEGIWIEGVRVNAANGTPGYTDFHIRACWPSVGQAAPTTIGTIVRLYEN